MAINSLKFRIEGDGTSALRSLSDVQRGVGNLKNMVANELNRSIKQAFSVYAIVEMGKRTGEWAENLSKTAQKLNLTTTELQGFQVAARRMNMESSELEGLMGTMENAALDAAKGNMELLRSFGLLKIGIQDIKNLRPAELFQKVLKGVSTGGTGGFAAAQEIFGGPGAIQLQYLARAAEGKSGAQLAAENPSQVVGEQDIADIRASWTETKKLFVEIGTMIAPLGKLILDVVNGLMFMFKGVYKMAERGWKMITFGIGASLGSEKSLEKFMDAADESRGSGRAFGHGVVNALKGTGNFFTRMFGAGDYFEYSKKPSDISDKVWEEGQGAGGAALFAIPGPKGRPFGKAAGTTRTGLGLLSKTSEITPAALKSAWEKAGMGPFKTPNTAAESVAMIKAIEKKTGKELGSPILGPKTEGVMGSIESIAGRLDTLGKGAIFAGRVIGGTGGLGQKESEKHKPFQTDMAFPGRNPLLDMGAWGAGGAGGSGNLKIGGVFGTDVSMKIVQLNAEMLQTMQQLLQVVSENKTGMTGVRPANLH